MENTTDVKDAFVIVAKQLQCTLLGTDFQNKLKQGIDSSLKTTADGNIYYSHILFALCKNIVP